MWLCDVTVLQVLPDVTYALVDRFLVLVLMKTNKETPPFPYICFAATKAALTYMICPPWCKSPTNRPTFSQMRV